MGVVREKESSTYVVVGGGKAALIGVRVDSRGCMLETGLVRVTVDSPHVSSTSERAASYHSCLHIGPQSLKAM